MKFQRLEALKVTIQNPPVNPTDAVRKQDLDSAVSGAPVFITDIEPVSSGIVGLKQYAPNTVPQDVVVLEATTDTTNVRVHFLAEASAVNYSPEIVADFDGNGPYTPDYFVEIGSQTRMFEGYFDINISQNETITLTSSAGTTASANIIYGADGPEASTVLIGDLPGTQTEAKQGDVVPFTATAPNDAVSGNVVVAAAAESGTLTLGAADSAGPGVKTVTGTFTVSGNSGALGINILLQNALGTNGDPVLSANQITLNQTYPSITNTGISYPAGQTALKGNESAVVSATVANFDSVVYSGSVDLSITDPNTYNVAKTVSRNSGSYVYGVDNYTVTATRDANGAVTAQSLAVSIANVAPSADITIQGNPTRLRSSASGEDYVIVVTATQVLEGAPNLATPEGTWQGSWTLNGNQWERVLRIVDTDARGPHSFAGLILPSIAGDSLDGSVINSGAAFTIGGFTARIITFSAFSQYEDMGVNVADISKTEARYVGVTPDLTLRNDTNNVTQSYTITDNAGTYAANGDHLFINDVDFANSNTSGTLQVEIEETE